MTVVAYDGHSLAADKQSVCGGRCSTTTKIRRISTGEVLAITGMQAMGEMLVQWYESGADPTAWPIPDNDENDCVRLIVADKGGCKFYEHAMPIAVEDAFGAWGSGADFAVMALHLGKTAREAVELASIYSVGCGNGVDSFGLR